MEKINFLFGIHNHQPVGNFDFVLEDAFEKSYKPFIDVLEKHPGIKMAVHFTGWLLEKIEKDHPDYISKIRGLVQKGQLEIFTGGFYEPIIPVIPEDDRIGQITKLSSYVENLFGKRPRGMWLAERVWEPQIAKSLALAGVEYVVVDDNHFKNAGYYDDELTGYFITEEEGYTLKVFPISKKLRYLIPFEEVGETLDFLKTMATADGNNSLVMFDDGEKFGVWPGTYDRVYKEGWLDEFFTEIEKNSEWLNVSTFSEYVDAVAPKARIYLPISSYSEMMEWALPTRAKAEFESLVSSLKEEKKYESMEMFLKGGMWRTFLAKYAESNLMHKKFLHIHERMKEVQDVPSEVLDEYWKGQCNDVYWHGVFGGLYLPHLRAAVYKHLIKAEKALDEMKNEEAKIFDYDKDGFDEVIIKNDNIGMVVDPDYGARVLEIDLKKAEFNLVNSLTRRYEVYHEWISKAITQEELEKSGESKTIHDVILTREEGLEKYLSIDWYERFSYIDHFFGEKINLEGYSVSKYPEQGDFVNQPYNIIDKNTFLRHGHVWIGAKWTPVTVEKRFSLNGGSLEVTYKITNDSEEEVTLHFGSEMTYNLMAPEDDDRYFEWDGQRHNASYKGEFTSDKVEICADYEEVHAKLTLSEMANFFIYPIYTVSYSEGGFEKVYQGTSLTPTWKFNLSPHQSKELKVILSIKE
ncbi:alpha-amylase/4-alpha-glucanotransferase domain-containing protein [Mesoaciditoga lauensis]|uniref:alpha-amylase/4-alpha-glucanotransferase domain-containing protein n=1 Tax=Mesoaciditoga lauensis TaxID=1495039 RepID=UPI000692201C|nr:alpha-amylase/4-alpha-glucanotransferase domain-containing protein [Mesoaciditoga lauensis]